MRRAGVVYNRRQAAECREREIDESLDIGIDGDVAGEKLRVAARANDRIDRFGAMRFMDVVDDDFRAFGGESRCNAASEARPRAGDNGDLVGETHYPCRMTTVLSVVNPYSASNPFSRPYPECLTPPNGNSMPPSSPWLLMNTWPLCTARAIRS